MQDRFGRTINYLRLSVTDRCNLRCRYCMPEEGVPPLGHGDILSYEELLVVVRAAVSLGVGKIRITGGEPLVRKGLCGFIAQLAALTPRPELSLTTNGLRLAELARDLRQAGLDRINLSLDTLRPERFLAITRRQGLDQVLSGLDAALAAGLAPLKLNMVPIAGVNEDEIADFARLTLTRPLEVRFIEYMPVSGGLDYPPERRVPAAEILRRLTAAGPLAAAPASGETRGPAQLYQLAGGQGRVGIIPGVSGHFCADCNRLRLTPDGRLRPCLLSEQEFDLRPVLRAGADEARIRSLIEQAVAGKPASHRLDSPDYTPGRRRMSSIGG